MAEQSLGSLAANIYRGSSGLYTSQTQPQNTISETQEAEFDFINYVLKHRVPIYDWDHVHEIISSANLLSNTGSTMEVFRGELFELPVAVKRLKISYPIDIHSPELVHQCRQRNRANILSVTKEVRFLSYELLQRISNVARLLGVSWNIEEEINHEETPQLILRPLLILGLEDTTLDGFVRRESSLGSLSLNLKVSLVVDIFHGLRVLHDEGLIHSDIKPDNILISERDGRVTAIVSDFGLSIQRDYPSDDRILGTSYWMSPETHSQFLNNGRESPLSLELEQACDIYSAGLTSMFILKEDANEVLPPRSSSLSNNADQNALHRELKLVKDEAQKYLEDWVTQNFRILDASGQALEQVELLDHLETYSNKAEGLKFEYISRENIDRSPTWLPVPENISTAVCFLPRYALCLSAVERKTADYIFNKLKSPDDLRSRRRTTWAAAVPRQQPWQIHNGASFGTIPMSMLCSTKHQLIGLSEQNSSSSTMKHFVGQLILDSEEGEESRRKGRELLMAAAIHSTREKHLEQLEVQQSALVEFISSTTPTPGFITPDQRKEWILDSIFLLQGGYFYHPDNDAHTEKLKRMKDRFKMAIENFSNENSIHRILDIGFTLYVIKSPTSLGIRPSAQPTEDPLWSAVFAADEYQISRLLDDTTDIRPIFDPRLVREVIHHGLDDSLRALGRFEILDTIRQIRARQDQNTERIETRVVSSLPAAIGNNTPLDLDSSRSPSRVMPAVFEAVDAHSFSCLTECLQYRPDLDAQFLTYQFCRETVLIMAIKMVRPYLVVALLEYGADPNMKCSCCEQRPIEILLGIDLVMRSSADIQRTTAWRMHSSYMKVSENSPEDIKVDILICNSINLYLLVHTPGIDISLENARGETPTDICLRTGNLLALKILWGVGVDKGAIGKDTRNTAFHLAALFGDDELLDHLAQKKPDLINAVNNEGFSPLALAAESGDYSSCQRLLRHNASLEVKENTGMNPVHIALSAGDFKKALLFLEYIFNNHDPEFNITFMKESDDFGRGYLHHWTQTIATQHENNATPTLSFELLDYFNKFNDGLIQELCQTQDGWGMTPLHWATLSGRLNLVERLVEHMANINIPAFHGYTALHFSYMTPDSTTVSEYLEGQGANKLATDDKNRVPHELSTIYTSNKRILKVLAKCYLDRNYETGGFEVISDEESESESIE